MKLAIKLTGIILMIVILAVGCAPKASAGDFEPFDASEFDNPIKIDNEWFPLLPGTQLTFEGFTVDQGTKVPHQVIFTVTDLVKEIAGVKTVVAWERDFSNGELVEAELVFFAQAKDKTVWSLGQYPEEYANGQIIDNPVWIHGIEEANAGISMLGDPGVDSPSYSQGWGPAVEYTDRGQVNLEDQEVCVPVDCFKEVLVIDETSLLEPDAHQLKYYASGVGNILVSWTGEDQTQETLELVSSIVLDESAMTTARSSALELEASAYINSKDVYGQTSPSVQAMESGGAIAMGVTSSYFLAGGIINTALYMLKTSR